MDTVNIISLVVSLILAAGGAAALNAFAQRRKVGADATSVVTAAARELIDPLRRELANERASHVVEIAEERRVVNELRNELKAAHDDVRRLRAELAAAWAQIEQCRRRIADLEDERGGPRGII